ncbi:hypothetical protein ACO3UB_08385 (plasmid) [Methanocaldococcus sp. 16A]
MDIRQRTIEQRLEALRTERQELVKKLERLTQIKERCNREIELILQEILRIDNELSYWNSNLKGLGEGENAM